MNFNLVILQKAGNHCVCVPEGTDIAEWKQSKVFIVDLNTRGYDSDALIWCTKKYTDRTDITEEKILASVRVLPIGRGTSDTLYVLPENVKILNPYNK